MEGSTRVDASDRAKRKMGPSAFTLKVAPRRPHPSVCRLESHAANVCLHPIPPLAPDEFSDRFVSKGVAWQPKWRETLSLSPMRDKQVISDACKGLTALAYIWVRSMYRRHFGKRFGNGFWESGLAAVGVRLTMLPAVPVSALNQYNLRRGVTP